MENTPKPRIHENFQIHESKQGERIKLVRQDRRLPRVEACYIELQDMALEVVNFSSFGLAVEAVNGFSCDAEQFDVPFIYDNVEVSQLHLRKVRTETSQHGIEIIAFEIIGEPLNTDKLEAVTTARKVIQLQQNYAANAVHIPTEVKAQVYEIQDWVEHLMAEIDEVENNIKHTSHQSVLAFDETIIEIIASYLGKMFPIIYQQFSKILLNLDDEIRKQSVDFLRQKLNHIIYQSPFAERVYNKPLGYAGDYEMMNLIYRQENVGKTLFSRCLHRYYIDEPAAQAVRNRADYLIGVITKTLEHADKRRPLRILSVACGPAMEWQKLLPQLGDNQQEVIVDLLDQDEQALMSTQNNLRRLGHQHNTAVKFQFINKAIKNIIGRGTDYKEYDLIYSAGLFDYLSDPVASMAASKMFKGIRPGGRLIIGNFSTDNPNQVGMEYALDWELIYRSEKDLLELFRNVGGALRIEKENLDINLFCVITKDD